MLEPARAAMEMGMLPFAAPCLGQAPRGDGHPVMVIPGFMGTDGSTAVLRSYLQALGYEVYPWGLGRNFGPRDDVEARMVERANHLSARHGRKISLVGWSLGGIFARELAKRHPDLVAKVITMGTPFSGSLYANNAWRIYQLVTGHSIDQPPVEAQVSVKPPVETVALWSPRDGVIAARSACGRPGERDRAIALRCTHLGFAHSFEAIRAVAEELERG